MLDEHNATAQNYILKLLQRLTRHHGTFSIVGVATTFSVGFSLLFTVLFSVYFRGHVPPTSLVIGGTVPLIVSPLALYSFVALVHRLDRAETHLRRLASEDDLTGVYNRRHILTLAEHEWARVERYGGSFSLIVLDVDHFKRVNDTHGHAAGDKVLQTLASVCRTQMRHTDIVGRLGGEEFLIVLPNTDECAAVRAGEHLRSTLAATAIKVEDRQLKVTVSLGIASHHDHAATVSLENLIKEADDALYAAKTAGRNRVRRTA